MKEQEIINNIKNKKEKGLIEFINQYGSVINGVIKNTLPNHNYLWDEIMNDTLLDIWRNIDSFDISKSNFKNWCAVISKYNSISALRKELRHYNIPLDEKTGIYNLDEIPDLNGFKYLLEPLKDEDKLIFIELFFNEKDYDEISKLTNLSKEVIYNRVNRGKKKLKEELEGEKNE